MSTKQTPVAASRQWLETLLLAAVGVGVFALYGANHPTADVSVGWLVLIPMLSGAQHGTLFGFLSAGTICSAGLVHMALGPLITQGWGLVFAGVGGIAGYFRDLDERRYAQLSYRARIGAQELEALERAYACLQKSHAELEQQLCTQPHSLASILDAARERMRELRSASALAELMLEVIASRTPVQSASLFALGSKSRVGSEPVASLCESAQQIDVANHPLVQRALRSDSLVSIVDAAARAQAPQGVLAAVALQSSCGRLRLLFVVHQLPFEAFCVEELRNLHVLLARLIDLVQQRLDALEEGSVPRRANASHTRHAAVGGEYSCVEGRRASAR